MTQLVLAIEPDTRQAAIVKRIVRERVLADVAVVDSRDAALEAMRTTIPDVLLLSALLSPRDEDELIAHLRTLRDAEHLQTHTIPQLASTIGDQDEKPSRGLLSAFRRKKGPESAPAGCDPDLFAEEIRTYLKHASDKKRQVRDGGPIAPIAMTPAAAKTAAAPKAETVAEEPASVGSSWESPFEWRPASSRSQAPPPPEPEPVFEPEPFRPEPLVADRESVIADPEPAFFDAPVAASETSDAFADAFPDAFPDAAARSIDPPAAAFEATPAYRDFTTDDRYTEPLDTRSASYDPIPTPIDSYSSYSPGPRVKYPLSVRTAKGWFFVEGKFTVRKDTRVEREPDSELHDVLASLAVPAAIAGVTYADGCRIRRVRLSAA